MDVDELAERLIAGERRALARAITLAESTRSDHRAAARALMARAAPHAGRARRIGLSGTPGVGKSTFIEAFGMMLVEQGLKVAVLAVDPTSARSGGSILGDKTRMDRLSRSPSAFIRPSPAGRELGGVARRTREAILLAEAAGFDVVIVETVGVGQSETVVAEMTDLFVLLLAPAGGDELQGVKRGIMEIADLVVVNKADGPLREVASRTRADYAGALRLMRAREGDAPGFPKALTASALTGDGLGTVWDEIRALDDWRRDSGWLDRRRAGQAVRWMRSALEHGLIERLYADPAVAARIGALESAVTAGRVVPEDAADELLALFLGPVTPEDGSDGVEQG
ncbi:methylmalonyl Co-A mutase-associated GTPase MeaB [Limibaculum sp. M0105]|uniref:Methylmalonyl Co-A mutase-associated GTPase MeaB n=1 Tax=Thermohalobaculum xanthum TaxID=2753746 RepID=A0A8J7M9T6_9RHOB|nr:methylmalonyl Co-A mutase-associated GTPase MeaB [Thermohalobaculum xanthum]MBK0400823.1 methylmalonyl Co-A mutase-associated GTPase MeaB [Thermohalobaculum xanthum]